ncbi:MAG: S8 family serine peptidase [Planctomycetota bacterium]
MRPLPPFTLVICLVGAGVATVCGKDLTLAIDPGAKLPRIDGRLVRVWQQSTRAAALAAAEQEQVPRSGELVRAIVESSHGLDPAAGVRLGGRVDLERGSLSRVLVPPESLKALAAVAGVRQVRAPYLADELVESEGVALTAADVYHADGERGKGARVAIIDLGFVGLSEAIEAGEVMQPNDRWNYADGPFEGTTVHGTAVAEIVADMAPECELTLIKVDDEIGLAKAAERCASQGLQIISHSVGWYNTNFYDGTGYVCDVARRAQDGGVLWVNAAGNSAERHYQGAFVDQDGDGLAEFAAGDEGIDVFVFQGMQLRVALTWDDWQPRETDYDLYLIDASGGIVARADGHQGSGEEPSEFLSYTGQASDTYTLAVRLASGPPKRFALHTFNADLERANRVGERSVVSPADADSVVAVGAVAAFTYATGPAEGFSSQGPTNAMIMKPDVVAPDMVQSSSYGYFGGTSAAAPHVAGAAALLAARRPGSTPNDLRTALMQLAMPMGDVSVYGAGRLSLEDHSGPNPSPLSSRPRRPPSPKVSS